VRSNTGSSYTLHESVQAVVYVLVYLRPEVLISTFQTDLLAISSVA